MRRALYFTLFSLALSLEADLCLQNLSLEDAERIAFEHNKQLLIVTEETVEAKERTKQALSKWFPSIHLDAQVRQQEKQEYLFNVFSSTFPIAKYAYHSQLQWDQPLFSTKLYFGLTARRLEEKSTRFEQASTWNELLFAVRDRYYGVILQELSLAIQKENVDYLSEALLQEQQKLDAGHSTPYEVNQSKVALANAISLFYETLKQLKTTRNALILTLGVDPMIEPELTLSRTEIPLDSIPELVLKMEKIGKKYAYTPNGFPTTLDLLLHLDRIEEAKRLVLFSEEEVRDYIDLAIAARPDLEMSRLLVEINDQELKKQRGKYLPEIGGYVRYAYNEDQMGPKSFFNEKYYLSGGVVLSWNLFDSFVREHEIGEAASKKRSAKIAYEKGLQAIEVQVRDGLYQLEEAMFAYLSADQGVLLAELARKQADEKLAAGKIAPLEYRDSVNQLALSRNLRNRASFQLISAYYRVRYATGQDVAYPSGIDCEQDQQKLK